MLRTDARGAIVKALSGFYYVSVSGGDCGDGVSGDGGSAGRGDVCGGASPDASGGSVYKCRARGIFKKEGISPLVGDEVLIDVLDEEDGFVTQILPRRNSFVRPAVANIDLFVATVAVCDPDPHTEVLDRLLVTAEAADADAVVCVNKADLGDVDFLSDIYAGIYDTLPVSARTGEGMDALKAKIAGKRSAFAGPSGVGKSSVINRLIGRDETETGVVSRKTGRGKHTTRHVEIFRTDFGAELFDTPGYSSFDGVTASSSGLGFFFPEIADAAGGCRFDNCLHADEPECAVRAAVGAGVIAESRYGSYIRMLNEAMANERKGTTN
jgi:ribosome biogenesis GTPase